MKSDKILESLYLFNEKYEGLVKKRFTKKLKGASVQIEGGRDKSTSVERKGPKGEDIDSFILTFRIFIQNNDPISIGRMAKIYSDKSIKNIFREQYTVLRNKINKYLDSETSLNYNEHQLTYREIMDIVIYGGYAHTNFRKREQFARWKQLGLFHKMIMGEFVFIMQDMLHFLGNIKSLNDDLIDDIDFDINDPLKGVEYGLIIKDPYITHILDEEKTIEVRKRNTNIRGRIALIKSGTGHIFGVTRLTGTQYSDKMSQMQATQPFHKIPLADLKTYHNKKGIWWLWFMKNTKKLKEPIPYNHPQGAVIWVRL